MEQLKKRHGQEDVGNRHAKDLPTIVVLKDKGDHEAKITVLEGELKPYTAVSQQHRATFFISCIGQEVTSHTELPEGVQSCSFSPSGFDRNK